MSNNKKQTNKQNKTKQKHKNKTPNDILHTWENKIQQHFPIKHQFVSPPPPPIKWKYRKTGKFIQKFGKMGESTFPIP